MTYNEYNMTHYNNCNTIHTVLDKYKNKNVY